MFKYHDLIIIFFSSYLLKLVSYSSFDVNFEIEIIIILDLNLNHYFFKFHSKNYFFINPLNQLNYLRVITN